MKNYDAKMALPIILKAAKAYDNKLNDKHFLIVYQKQNKMKTCCVGFRDMNFLHLTGVKTKMSAQLFYSACLSGKLSLTDIDVDTKGKAQQKLAVLPYLPELLYHNCMVGDFINSGIAIRADYFVGDTKAIISVGFRRGKSVDIPVTVYNENVKTLTKPTCKVLAVFSKYYNIEKYDECTYLAPNHRIENFDDDIKKVLKKSLYEIEAEDHRKETDCIVKEPAVQYAAEKQLYSVAEYFELESFEKYWWNATD